MSNGNIFNDDGNFEVWLRMAADNKITAKNSWSVELIDYFYNLSLDQDVNFQRIATILDGCVKTYAGRVDAAAHETGTLLSGLASQKLIEVQELVSNIIEEPKPKKRSAKSESTLVKNFDDIKRKSFETELNIDPVFKRVIGYFDDGGAKSLLLNNLCVDSTGRVVFDSSESAPQAQEDGDCEISRIVSQLGDLRGLKVCSSMEALKQLGANNGSVENKLTITDQEDEIVSEPEFDLLNDEVDYEDDDAFNDYENDNINEEVVEVPDYALMAYFDDKLSKAVVTNDHWKIKRLKGEVKEHRKYLKQPKEKFRIDFFKIDPDSVEDEIFSESEAKISIPKNHRKRHDRNCLPPDYHFNSERIVKLFIKDKIALKTFHRRTKREIEQEEPTEVYSEEQEMSRMMADITREDMQELNQSYIEDFSVPATVLHKKLQTLNFEKISKRVDIRTIKTMMAGKLEEGVTNFEGLYSDVPQDMNGSFGVYFICLLHLANDLGLQLQEQQNQLHVQYSLSYI